MFSIVELAKEILQIFLGDAFFLTSEVALEILESTMSNDIKYNGVYRELLTSFRLSLRKTAVRFKFLSFMDGRCIPKKLREPESLFILKIRNKAI